MAKFPLKNVLEGTKHFWTKSQGPDAEGAAVTANPLTIGYKDAEGKATRVTPTNMLPVGDAAAQAKLADILTKLSADPATQTTLAAILAKLISAPATEAKQDTLIGHVDGVESALAAIQDYVDGLEIALGEVDANPTAYTVLARLKDLATTIGEVQAAPTANTLLARLKSLEDKIDAITDGTTPAVTTLSGSKAVIIKSFLAETPLGAAQYWGANQGGAGGVVPLDVSKYPKKTIYVKNNTDTAFTSISGVFYKGTAKGVTDRLLPNVLLSNSNLAAGASGRWNFVNTPELGVSCIGFAITIVISSGFTGTVDIIIEGGI